ncbi:hypothetical protein RHS01_09079 [Rhizoctonia solani]|uniref:Uncharacterized protein n=1 Tax=Rhizoctonia solani TaxID=456999 RepID=A0A8H7I814_9AGAM|nr:hypothetical protein RHS01_09079 [Rhizoctonia solani]
MTPWIGEQFRVHDLVSPWTGELVVVHVLAPLGMLPDHVASGMLVKPIHTHSSLKAKPKTLNLSASATSLSLFLKKGKPP